MIGFLAGIAIGTTVVFLLSLAAHYTLLSDLRALREENACLRDAALNRLMAKVAVEVLERDVGEFNVKVGIVTPQEVRN